MAGVPHEQWSREDRASAASHSAAVNGIGMQRASMIAEYNARSAMSNRNLFKAKHLPYRLGPDGKEALDAADVKVTK